MFARPLFVVPIAHGGVLQLGERPLVMGILNVTPDSFAERRPLDIGAAIERALQIDAEGADLIDIGGESTRPGALPLSAGDELTRVMPVIEALIGRVRLPLSIDTYKADVARTAVAMGASIINDVSGLRRDPALAEVVAESGAALVIMHSRGTPETMMRQAQYSDVVGDVVSELAKAIAAARATGVPDDRVIVDPGLGFAKAAAHSYGVLARLDEIGAALRRPLLVGPSRKSFMREALDERPAVERDWGTAAAVSAAVFGGAHIVRVHAVAQMAQVVRVAEQIRQAARREQG
jgi:dihydropteroate synthase